MKKVVAVILICAVVAVGGYFAFFYKSDAEKIVERLETFEEAYSTGDFEGVIDCMDAKSRNALKGVGKLGSMVGGDVGPLDINFGSDLFSGLFALGVATQDEQVKFKVKRIDFTDDTHALVSADVWTSKDYLYDEANTEETFEMIKEKNDWYLDEF